METLNSEQLAKEGQAAYQSQDYSSAARLYQAAADSFLAVGDELKAAEMANNCSVAWLKAGNAQAAFDAASGTDQVFARKGDVKQQALAIGNQAAALEMLKEYDAAMSAYLRSAELLKAVDELDLRLYVLQAASRMQLRKRRFLEAYATMWAGIIGIRHPNFRQRLLKTLMQIPYNFMK